ncbi:hypothetical protein [Chitinibacter sp. ZOR0017]|uniref:DUF7674 family protein n=1 Tax=Chitinibacter sp. ZOR0017 TaxID=1339254 RepID=UPI0006488F2F|nr:hypothetical protein [Chitinibacter sp. ZOR0017]
MPSSIEVLDLIEQFKTQFPLAFSEEIESLQARHFDCQLDFGFPAAVFLEQICDRVNAAISSNDLRLVEHYFRFFSQAYTHTSDDFTRQIIDVAFVENLFLTVTPITQISWAWKILPTNLKSLYLNMWGDPVKRFGITN